MSIYNPPFEINMPYSIVINCLEQFIHWQTCQKNGIAKADDFQAYIKWIKQFSQIENVEKPKHYPIVLNYRWDCPFDGQLTTINLEYSYGS
jgi:hypothetical protein